MNKKLFLSMFLTVLYFIIWYSFGVFYQRIANESNGQEFIYQEDLRMSSYIAQVQSLSGVPIDAAVIRQVLKSMLGSDRNFVPYFGDKEVPLVLNDPLGEAWGKYYLNWAQKQGFSHFRCSISTSNSKPEPIFKVDIGFYQREISLSKGAKATAYHRMWIIDSENPTETRIYLLPTIEQAKTWNVVRQVTIWTKENPKKKIKDLLNGYPPKVRATGIYPILPLDGLLAAAVSDPDGSVHAVQRVLRGRYVYPLSDFLYFSAVTITTVGYGDILPNSSRVRLLVMTEALLGVVCIGAFVSSLFLGKQSK